MNAHPKIQDIALYPLKKNLAPKFQCNPRQNNINYIIYTTLSMPYKYKRHIDISKGRNQQQNNTKQ